MEDLKADLKALITGMKQITEAISRVHTGILQLAPALQACIDALPTKEEMIVNFAMRHGLSELQTQHWLEDVQDSEPSWGYLDCFVWMERHVKGVAWMKRYAEK